MLFNLLYPFADQVGLFNLFRYITFRTGGAVLTALVISFVVGPALIRWLRLRQGQGQPIRSDGPASHLVRKQGTPTMGGMLILLALTLATLLWADLSNGYVWVVMMITLGFGGMLGVGEKYHPIPWSVLDYDQNKGGYVVRMNKQELESSPAYDLEDLTHDDATIRTETYNYYHAPQYW